MLKKKLFIAGHNGMLGSAILKFVKNKNLKILIAKRKNLDLEDFNSVEKWFKKNKPDYVIIAAAKAGGIIDNSNYPVDYMLVNTKIQTNIISLSHKYNVKRLVFIGSSCIYPKFSKVPIKETELLCQLADNFSCVMPTNLFGPNDKYDERSHVIPALIKRMHHAKLNNDLNVKVWGDGRPKREFLYVEDCAKIICKILMSLNYHKLINIGTGKDITIKKLAETIKKIVGFKGKLIFDKKMPNGVMRKTMDISKIKKFKYDKFTDFEKALKLTYKDFLRGN